MVVQVVVLKLKKVIEVIEVINNLVVEDIIETRLLFLKYIYSAILQLVFIYLVHLIIECQNFRFCQQLSNDGDINLNMEDQEFLIRKKISSC